MAMTLFTACDEEDDDPTAELKTQVVSTYADIVLAGYEDSHEKAEALQAAINALVSNPSAVTLQAAKDAWLAAREPYGQTEAFRFAGGPIDDTDGPEGALNAWPLDESYVDYVSGNDAAGIINDPVTHPTITAEYLTTLNEVGGETNISIGYHAIEFLLWGQDQSTSGPGARPYTDYVVGGTAANQARRGQYLQACAELLVEHLHELVHEWEEGGSFRSSFTGMSSDAALTNILTGIGTLSKSELAGERIFTALDNQDQEDEHSCFSDNTHRDIVTNAKGIYNVIHGTYVRTDGTTVSGTSLLDLLNEENASLSDELTALSEVAISKAEAIPNPFDQAIQNETTGGSGPVMQTVNALREQGDKIAEAAAALGLTISTELPE